jgi:two-component system, chemotaxis family, response regulator Rcp1
MMRTQIPVEILLVEDSPEDIDLTKEALEQGKMKINLHTAIDGVEAMMFLRKLEKYTKVPTPDLILLDLNLPKKDGREVLAEVKMGESLKHIPVIILTTSKSDEDLLVSYKNYANCYITKPLDFKSFEEIVRSIEEFWFTIVKLPKNDRK